MREQIKSFPTYLSHLRLWLQEIRLIEKTSREASPLPLRSIVKAAFSPRLNEALLHHLHSITDEQDHHRDSVQWRILIEELKAVAALQKELQGEDMTRTDNFQRYAAFYDGLIGLPCLDSFMSRYITFFRDRYQPDFSERSFLSLGCGTGLVEKFMVDKLGLKRNNLLGMDFSAAMVSEAKKRIPARVGDILELDPDAGTWDLVYSGLNVFHYLDHQRLEEAIRRTAAVVEPGGYFFGDFITPDHIRWYPNVVYSADRKLISLRTPRLVEQGGHLFQESEIINLSFREEQMEINYAGKHLRHLPSVLRVRQYFRQHFGEQVELFDAHSLQTLSTAADSTASTRYLLVARKD